MRAAGGSRRPRLSEGVSSARIAGRRPGAGGVEVSGRLGRLAGFAQKPLRSLTVTDETKSTAEDEFKAAEGWGSEFTVMETEWTPHRGEIRRLADRTRELIERLMATQAPTESVARAAELVEQALKELRAFPEGRSYEGFAESANAGGDPRAFFDHSPIIGLANPLAAPVRVAVSDGMVHGQANFGAAYEGPPGHVHGGFIAASFDEVLGMAQSLGGAPGMTGTLTIKYRNPTPLHTDLRYEATLDRVQGRKLFTSGRLYNGDTLCAEAEGLFISVDFAKFAAMMAQRADNPPES